MSSYLRDGPTQINGISATFIALCWLAVAARCYVRAVVIKKFQAEDWLALITLLFYTLFCAFTFVGAKHGMGLMVKSMSPETMMQGLRAWWFSGIFYLITTAFLKASIAVQLLKLTEKKSQKGAIYAVLGVSIAYTTIYLFFVIIQCSPVESYWTGVLGEPGICIKPQTMQSLTIVHSVLNISADWFFAVMPCLLLKDLDLPKKTRITVAAILALGGLASCAVIVRLPYIVLLQKDSNEFLYHCTWVINCSTAENGLGISAGAMATLRPLFRSLQSTSRCISTSSLRESCRLKLASAKRRATWSWGRYKGDIEMGFHKKIPKVPDSPVNSVQGRPEFVNSAWQDLSIQMAKHDDQHSTDKVAKAFSLEKSLGGRTLLARMDDQRVSVPDDVIQKF